MSLIVPKLVKIEDLLLRGYYYLDESDECYFLRERMSGARYSENTTNQLIKNLKIPPSVETSSPARWPYKKQAIRQVVSELQQVLNLPRVLNGKTLTADHENMAEQRPTPDERAEHYTLAPELINPPPKVAVLFDDVITTGSHFKAAKKVLQNHYGLGLRVVGLFIARAKRRDEDFSIEFDSL